MHADLIRLLELQAKDGAVAEVDRLLEGVGAEIGKLDQALAKAREGLDTARRAATEGARRRDELESKIESYRVLQERRQQRLEHVRNPKEASTLMAELELARSVMAKEESDWVRSSEAVTDLERRVKDEEMGFARFEDGQTPAREELDGRRAELAARREAALADREQTAGQMEKQLRTRYERLRRSRGTDVVVPLVNGGCGACHTAVPLNRRSQIRTGTVVDGCEACGAILYPPELARSPE
jgi:predicted  nucleic acid-binding Zn-ribbon protein